MSTTSARAPYLLSQTGLYVLPSEAAAGAGAAATPHTRWPGSPYGLHSVCTLLPRAQTTLLVLAGRRNVAHQAGAIGGRHPGLSGERAPGAHYGDGRAPARSVISTARAVMGCERATMPGPAGLSCRAGPVSWLGQLGGQTRLSQAPALRLTTTARWPPSRSSPRYRWTGPESR
jgi:hypothetical protein